MLMFKLLKIDSFWWGCWWEGTEFSLRFGHCEFACAPVSIWETQIRLGVFFFHILFYYFNFRGGWEGKRVGEWSGRNGK